LGNSETTVRLVQIACDGFAALVIFLIAYELMAPRIAVIAALLVGLSPQLACYPLLLLPDSVAVLPLLLAIYCLARACRSPTILLFMVAGSLVGISCLLRANALLLPLFLAAIVPLIIGPGKRWLSAAALILSRMMVIIPVTIKNFIVFDRFVPLSLGAGQKLLEGVAEYDQDGRFGIPKTDVGMVLQEAQFYNREDYAHGLFTGDGVERDRRRMTRGLTVVRAHPLWYFGVMVRRASSFLNLARTPPVSAQPTFSHSLQPTTPLPRYAYCLRRTYRQAATIRRVPTYHL
jgi:4-amino-4-deoxy-L-arabinose transferase-like glycosyltransferase